MKTSFRGGMQVHAVPDDERALDSRGQPLPWGYAWADARLNRKQPVEKGPFGKSTLRRTASRSRTTATPTAKEDIIKLENFKVVDDIFTGLKADLEEQDKKSSRKLGVTPNMPRASSTIDVVSQALSGPAAPAAPAFKEPTEIILYGYGSEYQYAAIAFYESATNGCIYENYDRYPPHPRYNTSIGTQRPRIPQTLSPAAIRKINTYQGGDHWIKVTFDSPEAAELACHYSPHTIHGYAVYAEPYRGERPVADVAISASSAIRSEATSVRRRRLSGRLTHQTWDSMPSRMHSAPILSNTIERPQEFASSASSDSTISSATVVAPSDSSTQIESSATCSMPAMSSSQNPGSKPMRIPGSTRAILLPASSALLPVTSWTTRTLASLPLVGALFGGNGSKGDVIGCAVPRKEGGNFDWEKASFWWRTCWVIDKWFGTDTCGLKGED